jgi:hypothetical protein
VTGKDLFGNTIVVRTNRDGKVDSDGFVDVASGHGFRLGTNSDNFFDHSRNWTIGGASIRGSWYRVEAPDTWKFSNHETIHRLAPVGTWISTNIVGQAGPIPAAGAFSVWP